MIYGVGIDIVENHRIGSARERWGGKFLRRIFTDREMEYCLARRFPDGCLAARFAAKEAFIKASGGLNIGHLRDIEVDRDEKGAPYIRLYNRAALFAKEAELERFHLSISHEQNYSTAMVVIER